MYSIEEITDTVILGNSLVTFPEIPSESIDLVFTSPPYNLGNSHHTGKNKINPYDDNLPEEEYQSQQLIILNECYRVLKPNGSMWYNHKNRIKNGVQITPYQWILKSNFTVKQEIVWFNRSQNFDKIRFYPMTERVYWLAKSPKTKMCNNINHHDLFTFKEWEPQGTKAVHKRAFPVQMVLDILACFEDAEIVLDPYFGSGSVGVGCKIMDRKFIGIEIDPSYCAIAIKRIKETMIQSSLPLF